ncbi:hypothetical protein V5O48_002401 [Marasmius crinis-equi]|uniref:Uncharacterized protein n=1 Tax=Marasmius crinis-equi TaxID=585013 RepID=A0ABR3FVR9_9AGAR
MPIKLPLPEGANLEDFVQFVRATYALTVREAPPDLERAQWISVLKLSTCWMFDDLRKLSIEKISETYPSCLDRAILGRSYNVRSWFLEGLQGLACPSHALLPLGDFEGLGDRTALRVLYLRSASSRTKLQLKIEDLFADELASIELAA